MDVGEKKVKHDLYEKGGREDRKTRYTKVKCSVCRKAIYKVQGRDGSGGGNEKYNR